MTCVSRAHHTLLCIPNVLTEVTFVPTFFVGMSRMASSSGSNWQSYPTKIAFRPRQSGVCFARWRQPLTRAEVAILSGKIPCTLGQSAY